MNINKISKYDTANGPGIRTTLWVSGCNHHCHGCHNPDTWNPSSGTHLSDDMIVDLLNSLSPNYIHGLTLSGGDPLYPDNRSTIATICNIVKTAYPNKSIWLYTGYKWEDICDLSFIKYHVDVVVDGRYEESLRDISLTYCGSTNQRVIDVKRTLASGTINFYGE